MDEGVSLGHILEVNMKTSGPSSTEQIDNPD